MRYLRPPGKLFFIGNNAGNFFLTFVLDKSTQKLSTETINGISYTKLSTLNKFLYSYIFLLLCYFWFLIEIIEIILTFLIQLVFLIHRTRFRQIVVP